MNHICSIRFAAPPGEEDEEDGLRNGFLKGQENETNTHSFSRQSGYKPRRSGSSDGGAYAGSAARHKDDTSGSPSQPKIIFNEDEYTRITTPRQDMLFKKGYLSRKKPWTGNANTSATSSTTESQSASHSTAGRGIGRNVMHFIQFLTCLVRAFLPVTSFPACAVNPTLSWSLYDFPFRFSTLPLYLVERQVDPFYLRFHRFSSPRYSSC